MREIKFQYGFESVNGIVNKVYYLHEIPKIEQKCDVWNTLPIKYVRQFTGLKDKNGNDIFEGDVCKKERHKELYEIVFYKSSWAVKSEDENAIWHQEFCNGARAYDIEIIGNIYENPDLLK